MLYNCEILPNTYVNAALLLLWAAANGMRLRSRTDDGQSKELEEEKAATLLLLVGWDKLIIYVSIFSSKCAFLQYSSV